VDTSYNDIFSTKGLNSLTYNDPYAKLCFTSMIASKCQKKVIYIDLDTMFAAYAKSDLISLLGNTKCINKTINIYLPTEDRFEYV
jgi:lipopolysaccharide biosynthesis glycosyltransferase